ncbi:right-handed parallel beta-helix repeat-containing protein [Methanobrevibacter sp.]
MFKHVKNLLIVIVVIMIVTVTVNCVNAENATESHDAFSDLSKDLNVSGNNISLCGDYKFDPSIDNDLIDGVKITGNVSIRGNGAIVDGGNQARGFFIDDNSNVTLENLTFKDCFSKKDGGAILIGKNSSVIIRNCHFINNKVYNSNGGAIYCMSSTGTEIHDCYFFNNTSIRQSTLEWNLFKKGMGSAICVNIDSDLKLYNSKFIQNNAYLSTILVISYDDVKYGLSNLHVNDCLFENNTSRHGGVIYLDELGKGEFISSIFRKNTASETGAALILDASLYALVNNCLFENNYARRGGGILIKVFEDTPALNVIISNSNFTKNTASISGGAIHSKLASTTILNCIFTENTAADNGGAVCINQGTFQMRGSYFYKNSANAGGGLYIKNANSNVEDSNFIKNRASLNGGGVYSNAISVQTSNCNYNGNSAPKGANVFGVFIAQIKQIDKYFNTVKLKIKLSSPWKTSLSQKIKLKFKGPKTYSTKWLKTSKSGILVVTLPANWKIGKYSVSITMDSGICRVNPMVVKILKAPCKVTAKKFTAKHKSKKYFRFYVKNSKTGKAVGNVKVKLKVFSGKHYKSYILTTNHKGMVKFKVSKLSVGKHAVEITKYSKSITFAKKKSKITIKKHSKK